MTPIGESPSRKLFLAFNAIVLAASAVICLLPMINLLAVSLSSAPAAAAGYVKLWPVDFTLDSYEYVARQHMFWITFGVTLKRIALALPLTLLVILVTAYPMSKDSRHVPGRAFYTYFFLIPMLFGGGLIPWYLTVRALHLTNTIWGLVIPGLLPVFSVILLMNFFRNLPKEIEDAAFIDGAGPITALVTIFVPLSLPCIATIALFTLVGNWNSWFDGIILMDSTRMYPVQSYLQSLLVQIDPSKVTSLNLDEVNKVSNRTFKAAQIFIATVPILLVYPFLQKYFTSGIVMGSVKG